MALAKTILVAFFITLFVTIPLLAMDLSRGKSSAAWKQLVRSGASWAHKLYIFLFWSSFSFVLGGLLFFISPVLFFVVTTTVTLVEVCFYIWASASLIPQLKPDLSGTLKKVNEVKESVFRKCRFGFNLVGSYTDGPIGGLTKQFATVPAHDCVGQGCQVAGCTSLVEVEPGRDLGEVLSESEDQL